MMQYGSDVYTWKPCFPFFMPPCGLFCFAFRQDFGRVQALIAVFSRIVDVENFSEVVLSAVRGEEKRELEHRLGILNVLNPVRVSCCFVPPAG